MRFLLLSYYAPPLNGISAYRAYSLGKLLSQSGHSVDLVTRRWTGREKAWPQYLASTIEDRISMIAVNSNFRIHYLPYTSPLPKLNKFKILMKWLQGDTNVVFDPFQFYPYMASLCTQNPYDYLYTTCPPENCVKVIFQLSEHFQIPYLLDFRDYFNAVVLRKHGIPRRLELFGELAFRLSNRKILQKATLITTASEPFTLFIQKHYSIQRVITVLNGYETDFCDRLVANRKKKLPTKFSISCIGTLYPSQNLFPLIEGIKIFLDHISNHSDILINFIGALAIPDVAQRIREQLPYSNVRITPFLPRKKALEIGLESQILIYAGWSGHKGVYSGKIFEYLGLRRTILIAPRDHDVLDRLLEQTKAGYSFDTPEEVGHFLLQRYQEWKTTGSVHYHGIEEEIKKYTRENQNRKFLDYLLSHTSSVETGHKVS
jgi:glycosyltransferase involved in cell wall biosynthesis